ncbi:MAG: response regulator [Deltaproteobacteria bacterium]|nr:response regulator [Deltaproteobacteria bacterium]
MDKKLALVVDDEKNIRLTFSETLAQIGFDTRTAATGEEALSRLEKTDFDLALLDFRMSGMDGIELLRRIREGHPKVRVIMITAHGTIESAVEAMKLGAVDFLQKPCTPAEIRELVGKVMEREVIDESQAEGYPTLIELAKKCIADYRFEAAGAHVRKAVAIDPSRPEAFNLLGAILEVQGAHPSAALKNYHAALSLDPSYIPARKNIERIAGENKYRRGKIDIDRN